MPFYCLHCLSGFCFFTGYYFLQPMYYLDTNFMCQGVKFPDQHQYLGNCPPTPPLTQQQSIDNKLRLMLGWGRGRWAVAQVLILIQVSK